VLKNETGGIIIYHGKCPLQGIDLLTIKIEMYETDEKHVNGYAIIFRVRKYCIIYCV
jgi:hypothetical protein